MPTIEQALAQLYARIERLEAEAPKDSTSLNVVQAAADGSITFNFAGHVHAQGLDLTEATSSTPPTTDIIQWLANDDPAKGYESIRGYFSAGGTVLDLLAGGADGLRTDTFVQMRADANGGLIPILQIESTNAPSGAVRAAVQGANVTRLIIDDAKKSDWLQCLAEQGLKVIRGVIDTTGPTVVKGAGFSVAKNAVGDVTITFSVPFGNEPAVVATAEDAASGSNTCNLFSAAAATARVQRLQPGVALHDGLFHFHAIGPA